MSMGSASELEYFLLLSRDLGYVESDVYTSLAGEVVTMRRMLNGLISKDPPRTLVALSAKC